MTQIFHYNVFTSTSYPTAGIFAQLFVVDLFTLTRKWNQPSWPPRDKHITKLWHIKSNMSHL